MQIIMNSENKLCREIISEILLYFRKKGEKDAFMHNTIVELMREKYCEIEEKRRKGIKKINLLEHSKYNEYIKIRDEINKLDYKLHNESDKLIIQDEINKFIQKLEDEKKLWTINLYNYYNAKYNFTLKDHLNIMINRGILFNKTTHSTGLKSINMYFNIINEMGIKDEIKELLDIQILFVIFKIYN